MLYHYRSFFPFWILDSGILYSALMFSSFPSLDDEYRRKGYPLIAGVDEAGRGPLAGPVFAAAVILPSDCDLPPALDSKKYSPSRREAIFEEILSTAVSWHVARVENRVIDETNILKATMRAMVEAVKKLSPTPSLVLVDGIHSPFVKTRSRTVKKGDSVSQSIGAASILAKVERDKAMAEYHRKWPQYGFDRHKGYGTREHMEAIRRHGPCPIHRMTFKGVREHIKQY
jgi:ribonuclease HII